MASSDHNTWFPEQPTPLSSLDAMVAAESSGTFRSRLPPIPEQGWDFGWEESMFTAPDPYAGFQQASTTIVESNDHEDSPLHVHEELRKLRDEIQQLRRDISELQGLFCKRIDSIETGIIVAQRYVNDLVPWSMEVHEKYSKLLEMAEKQEKQVVDKAT